VEGLGLTYLLDTAPWINAVTMPHVLPARVRALLKSESSKCLCSISLLETAILHRLGRLQMTESLDSFFALSLTADLQLVDLNPAIATMTNMLPKDFHGDPFDRTIVATAAVHGFTLITSDPAIRDANACAIDFYPFKPSRTG